MSKGSTFRTALIVFKRIGNVQAKKTIETLDVSPIPSSNIKTGNNAKAAVFRNSSNTGFNSSFANGYQPMISPKGMETKIAKPNPLKDRTGILAYKMGIQITRNS